MKNGMDFLTFLFGIVTLLGFSLQLMDLFPKHRSLRRSTVLIVFGIFIGSLISGLQGVAVTFTIPITPFSALVGVFVLLLSLIIITAILSKEQEKRKQLFAITGFGIAILMFLLFFGSLISHEMENPSDTKRLSTEELVYLSDVHLSKRNFERSIYFLTLAEERFLEDDFQYQRIGKRIDDIQKMQIEEK